MFDNFSVRQWVIKAAPSVEAHYHVHGPNTGRNSAGRWIQKKRKKTFGKNIELRQNNNKILWRKTLVGIPLGGGRAGGCEEEVKQLFCQAAKTQQVSLMHLWEFQCINVTDIWMSRSDFLLSYRDKIYQCVGFKLLRLIHNYTHTHTHH